MGIRLSSGSRRPQSTKGLPLHLLRRSEAVAGPPQRVSASTIDGLLAQGKGSRNLRRNRNPVVERLIYWKLTLRPNTEL